MTRKTEIEEAMDKYTDNKANYLEYSDDGWEDKTDLEYVERAFKAGAQWADEHPDIEAIKAIEDHAYFAGSEAMREKMTNKACEWLYVQFNYGDMECGNIMEFIERFKKAMNL